ncbi:MAG: hypothetical protein AB1Z23_02445 [Eubacteriales bacterium]
MKKLIPLLVLLLAISMMFSGCAAITNIFDPLPDNYVDGVKIPKEFPDDYLEVYDDAVVYEAEEDDGEVTLMCGTEDEIDDVIDFYEDLFDDEIFTIDETDDGRGEYFAKGVVEGYGFEIFAEDASGDYEERAFATVIEVKTRELGKDTLEKMQGFWHVCGFDGEISDEVRTLGLGLEVDENKIDSYKEFEINSNNIEFSFVDDETIVYTDDGEEYMPKVTFEKIDGISVMTMEYEGDTLHLEKSSMEKMSEYAVPGAEMLAKMQGFWLVCGVDGDIYDAVRMQGSAVIFEGNQMSSYSYFELDEEVYEIEFIDDSTFVYTDAGEQVELTISFETIDGLEVMSMTDGDTTINLEKSSVDTMWTYYEMDDDGALIYLSDVLTDAQLEYYISGADWTFVYLYDTDGQYYNAEAREVFTFFSDYTGLYEYEGVMYDTTWYVSDSIIYIYIYDDTSEFYVDYMLDMEYDGEAFYMYLFDSTLGHQSSAYVYTVIFN